MNKNGVIAVVVVVVAVILIGLWAMRGQQNTSDRLECSAPPPAPANLVASKNANVVTLKWTPPASSDPVATYVVEAGNSPGANNVGTFIAPGSSPTFQRDAPPGTYYVRVLARNACGAGAPSNEIVVTVP